MTPLNWTALERVHDIFAAQAFKSCEAGAEILPQLFIVNADVRGNLVEAASVPAETMQAYFEDGDSKDLFSQFLRSLITPGQAEYEEFVSQAGFAPNVLVQLGEAWVGAISPDEPLDECYRSGEKSASEHPNRRAALGITLHLPHGSIPVFHYIEDKPSRHCVAEPFPSESEMDTFEGRFALQDDQEA